MSDNTWVVNKNGAHGSGGSTSGAHGQPINASLSRAGGVMHFSLDRTTTPLRLGTVILLRSKGGHGGDGADGQPGANGTGSSAAGGNGGPGGNGGNGGNGGDVRVSAHERQADLLLAVVAEVQGGEPGTGGSGGVGGRPGSNSHVRGSTGTDGCNGQCGADGHVTLWMGGRAYPEPFRMVVDQFGVLSPQHRFLEPGGCWHAVSGVRLSNLSDMPLPCLEEPLQVRIQHDAFHFDTSSTAVVPPTTGHASCVVSPLLVQAKAVDVDMLPVNTPYRQQVHLDFNLLMPGIQGSVVFRDPRALTVAYPAEMWVALGGQVAGLATHGAVLGERSMPLRVRLRNHGGHRMNERRAKVQIYVTAKFPQVHGSEPHLPEGVTLVTGTGATVLCNTRLGVAGCYETQVAVPRPDGGEARYTDMNLTLQIGAEMPAYTAFNVHVDLLLEHATEPELYITVQRCALELAVAEELAIGEQGHVDVLLCVSKAVPLERIRLWQERLGWVGLKCAVYDLTLYDGLHLGASVSSIVQRVSPDSTRCNGGARTLGQAVQGGTVLFFDDAVADLTEAGEATHQTQRTTRAMFLTDAVAAGLSESGLAVVGGRSSLKAQRESLMATVAFPVDPVACVSHRRG